MYKAELEKKIADKNYLPNFFALYGADNFQTELFCHHLKQKINPEDCLKLYFEEYDFIKANDYLASSSLFSERKLLQLKCSKKPSTKDLKHLINLCKSNTNHFFLLELYDEGSKQSELEKVFENHFVRFFRPNNAKEAISLLQIKANQLQISISQNALYLLFESFNQDLYLCSSELNKFIGLNVDEKVIEKYCYSLSVIGFDEFFEKFLQGKDLRTELEKLLDDYNEIAFINALSSNFYRLFKITLYAKNYGKVDLKELLGYIPPPQIAQKLQQQAFKLKITQYKQIFALLLQSECELKTNSKLIKKEFLLANLLKLSQILKH